MKQVGEQDLALGFKFNAKGTIDCYEGDMEEAAPDAPRRREIAFNMVDGDFKLFQGKWSVVQEVACFLPACLSFSSITRFIPFHSFSRFAC
jgi:ribosome-associated toxin RatA of RatAB toxin-antitoxin module